MSRINVPPDLLPRAFDSAVKKALEKTADRLSNEFDKEIDKSKWPWDRGETIRKQRPPVGSPRDIVDTGDLKSSKKQEIINPYSVKWTWEVDYSAIVHNGGQFFDGTEYPARPWTRDAPKEANIEEYFADILRREIDG